MDRNRGAWRERKAVRAAVAIFASGVVVAAVLVLGVLAGVEALSWVVTGE